MIAFGYLQKSFHSLLYIVSLNLIFNKRGEKLNKEVIVKLF